MINYKIIILLHLAVIIEQLIMFMYVAEKKMFYFYGRIIISYYFLQKCDYDIVIKLKHFILL